MSWLEQRLTIALCSLGTPKGASVGIARCVSWFILLGVLSAVLYVAFWFALILLTLWVAVAVIKNADLNLSPSEDDRRNDPSYTPENFNDTPDARFELP